MTQKTINWRGSITIDEVLAEIRSDSGRPFWLAFVRSSGKETGSVKTVSKCLYGSPKPKAGRLTASLTDRKSVQHTEKGTLPMTDHDSGQYLTPLISHIIGYNLYKVVH